MDQRRVVIADALAQDRAVLRASLARLGQQVVVDAATGDELLTGCRGAAPDVLIADLRLADGQGASAAIRAAAELRLPVIAVSSGDDASTFCDAPPQGVYAYLVKPIRDAELAAALAIAERRHGERAALEQEVASARQLLADRKIIERAKGILMRRSRIDEPEAFSRLRLAARQHRRRMVDVARSLLAAEADGEEVERSQARSP